MAQTPNRINRRSRAFPRPHMSHVVTPKMTIWPLKIYRLVAIGTQVASTLCLALFNFQEQCSTSDVHNGVRLNGARDKNIVPLSHPSSGHLGKKAHPIITTRIEFHAFGFEASLLVCILVDINHWNLHETRCTPQRR